MNWIIPALAAPAVAICISFVDKFVVETRVPSFYAVVVYIALTNALLGLFIWLGGGALLLPLNLAAPLLLAGLLWPAGGMLYFKALRMTETSRIVVLAQMMPVWVLLMAAVFLGEVISLQQLAGFACIIAAAVGISVQRTEGRLGLSTVFWLLLLAGVLRASTNVLSKAAVDALVVDLPSLATSVAYVNFGIGGGGLLAWALMPRIRHDFSTSVGQYGLRVLPFFMLSETLLLGARTLYFFALSLGPVALVTVLGSVQTFYAILLGWMLTLIAPAVFRETIDRGALLRKGGWALLLVAGIALLA